MNFLFTWLIICDQHITGDWFSSTAWDIVIPIINVGVGAASFQGTVEHPDAPIKGAMEWLSSTFDVDRLGKSTAPSLRGRKTQAHTSTYCRCIDAFDKWSIGENR